VEVVFYEKSDGSVPAKEFISGLDKRMQAKIARLIFLLKEEGNHLRAPYSKELEDGILELRAALGGNSVRVLYFFVIGDIAVLTNGFMKKSMRTPRLEIERAKRYRDDFLRRDLR